jgi:hypothetical protein
VIFTLKQWHRVYDKYHGGGKPVDTVRPPDLLIGILDRDAVEFGIHPTWVEWWNHGEGSDYNSRWANTVHVMLWYGREHKMFLETWSQPRD